MTESVRSRILWFRNRQAQSAVNAAPESTPRESQKVRFLDIEIDSSDPLLAYITGAPGVIDVDRVAIDSVALRQMKAAKVKLVVPLISRGELIGLLNLGPRCSEENYSADDKRLLNTLATQAAPALRVAQLVRRQQEEVRERERVEQEMRVARVIQETLLPDAVPALPHWRLEPYWQPARAVSGDFYDFLEFSDGRLALIVADVTDKGVPAALVMATARSLLRTAAERLVQPGEVLRHANDQLCPDIPPKMFVTCLYILLDPATGELILANAGHNLPIWVSNGVLKELRATGMPLGLMPGMNYLEVRAHIEPGDRLLLYSDGIVEAHNPSGEMFGFARLRDIVEALPDNVDTAGALVGALNEFTGAGWEQEDDVTLLTVKRLPGESGMEQTMKPTEEWSLISEFGLPSVPGNERRAMEMVAEAATANGLPKRLLDRLKTAVAETTMNAMEHGNQFLEDLPVEIGVYRSPKALMVRVTDFGGGKYIPKKVLPDLDAKLEGLQSPRGWGLFLIENMVDEMHIHSDQSHHIVELILKWEAEDE